MAAAAAPASPFLRGGERVASELGKLACGGRRGRADRASPAAVSRREAGLVHAEPARLNAQDSSSGYTPAVPSAQGTRPQPVDKGSSPIADRRSQEVNTLVRNLQQQMEASKVAHSNAEHERNEAEAKNKCFVEALNSQLQQVQEQGGLHDLDGRPGQDSQLINLDDQDMSMDIEANVEGLNAIILERDAYRKRAHASEEQRKLEQNTAQDTLDNVLMSSSESNARYAEEIRWRDAQNAELM